MRRTDWVLIAIAGMALALASTSWANVPAPPVNQDIGFLDADIISLSEADCRVCHTNPANRTGLCDACEADRLDCLEIDAHEQNLREARGDWAGA